MILAERIADKKLCAIKAVSKKDVLSQDSASITFLEREILALGDDCPFLTGLYAAFQTKERLFFVMEFVSGGDLFHHIVEVQALSSCSTWTTAILSFFFRVKDLTRNELPSIQQSSFSRLSSFMRRCCLFLQFLQLIVSGLPPS